MDPENGKEKADYISRLIDFDDWQITPDFFLVLVFFVKKSYRVHTRLTVLLIFIQ